MKSLTNYTAIAVIFLLSVVFSSCDGEISNIKGSKIILIEPSIGNLCNYTTDGKNEFFANWFLHNIVFVDTCGKYKIGDVVCVARKN